MKSIVLITLLFTLSIYGFADNINVEPKVDKRIELLSTVFRLAEAHEYVNNDLEDYAKEVDAYFKKFKHHKVVKLAKKARLFSGVSFDAVASMATSIEITPNGIQLQPNLKEESLDDRWKPKKIKKFVSALNDFYQVSKFDLFYEDHTEFYKRAQDNFNGILNEVDFDWFESFYGENPKGDFKLVLAMLNGRSNYGSTNKYKNGGEEIYAIIGVSKTDDEGFPIFKPNILEIVIHEFNHSLCNKLMESHYDQMKDKSQEIFKLVKDNLRRQAYSKVLTMNCEILVRACVIQYYKEKQLDKDFQIMIANEQSRGFLWIDKLCDELDEYEKKRTHYASLSDFMPEIVNVQNNLDVDALWEDYYKGCPQIIGFNIENGSKNVDPAIDTLIITFDQPMFTRNYGMSYGKKGKKYFPEFQKNVKPEWKGEATQWTIPIILKPGKTYSLMIPDQFFRSENYKKLLKKDYFLDFKTSKK
ncbi:MAG: hypothetical protein C0599_06480 [Salinivirgaceae bacterium]|nr:MAG: hypothetical protein C0599_06480 [Salinivirgaceae bacterium]